MRQIEELKWVRMANENINCLFLGAVSSEGLLANQSLIEPDTELSETLKDFFLGAFKVEGGYTFGHELDVAYNGVYVSCQKIFENKSHFLQESQNLLKILYATGESQPDSESELYTVYFDQLDVGKESGPSIGIFKSQGREHFLKIYQNEEDLLVHDDEGIGVKNLLQGALIFQSETLKNYKVYAFDKSNKSKFWIQDFLNLEPLEDDFNQTRNFVRLCKDFALKGQPDLDRTEQVDLLNRSVAYLKEKEQFDQSEFEDEVLLAPEMREAFDQFRGQFEEENNLNEPLNSFPISESAVKSSARYLRSVIKLDKNFHLYIHGKRELVEKGYDSERGQHYYKLFFDQEH